MTPERIEAIALELCTGCGVDPARVISFTVDAEFGVEFRVIASPFRMDEGGQIVIESVQWPPE